MTDILKEKKAIIFDLDGTLVDSMWMWKRIDMEFLARYGHSCPPELQKAIEGMSFTETAMYFKEKFCLPLTVEQIKRAWIEMSIDKYRREVPAKRGAKEFLSYARDRGMLCGIATSNSWEMVDAVLDSLGMRPFFQVVTTACQVKAGKPSPDIYLKVAEDLHVSPGQCLVFEDVPAGILAGKRAGMTVCAVEDAFSRHMEEEKRGLADYFISDYFEIMDGGRL
ncbi:MAG: HAD family phosphatase [Hungatella sp.]|jgi:16S rRNA pseudouridine516 synthase|nr:HAD family phosphatase [Hungatella sp.]